MHRAQVTPSGLNLLFPSKTVALVKMRISKHQQNLHMPVIVVLCPFPLTSSPPCVYSPFVSASSHLLGAGKINILSTQCSIIHWLSAGLCMLLSSPQLLHSIRLVPFFCPPPTLKRQKRGDTPATAPGLSFFTEEYQHLYAFKATEQSWQSCLNQKGNKTDRESGPHKELQKFPIRYQPRYSSHFFLLS